MLLASTGQKVPMISSIAGLKNPPKNLRESAGEKKGNGRKLVYI